MNSNGFTVVEMAVVILIAGFLMLPAFKAYDTYLYNKRVTETREHVKKLQSEISIYAIKKGHYPCPADRSLPPDDPMYGREDCSFRDSTSSAICKPGSDNGVCRYVGARDLDGNGTNEPILMGGVPFITLGDLDDLSGGIPGYFRRISSSESLDGWGNQISYAVSESLTTDDYDDLNGVILMIDEHGNPQGDYEMVGTPPNPVGKLHFALVAHGKDGLGAFSADGTQIKTCASGIYGDPSDPDKDPDAPDADVDHPPGTPARKDVFNCDPNGTFLAGLDFSGAEGINHFDDLVIYGTSATSALWTDVRNPDGTPTGHIHNLNDGNVGFGTDTPETTLDVNGDIRAETRVRSPRFCNEDETRCFDTAVLTGDPTIPADSSTEGTAAAPGIHCSNNRVLIGISNSDEQCDTPALPTTWTATTCPIVDGQQTWLRGVSTNGEIICTVPTP